MSERLSTGIAGLDRVLHGGLLPGQVYLVRGQPGAGKTTLAVQFLLAGVRRGEPALFITLAESETQLKAAAAGHGWDLDGVPILDIRPGGQDLSPDHQYSLFHPADVELTPATRMITEAVERWRPTRVVLDSLTEVRLLSRDLVRYRRQVMALIDYLSAHGATTLFLGESGHQELDVEITPIVQGVISLSMSIGRDGQERRSLRIEKYRASAYHPGEHDLRIVRGGVQVFPRLLVPEQTRQFESQVFPSGIAELDRMLGGGLDRGTSTLLIGNSGFGKTTLGLTFLAAAAGRGERGVLYSFDEEPQTIIHRCEAMGIAVRGPIERGLLHIQKVNPKGLYPDEFAAWICEEVERKQARLVMIDTLNGFGLCMPDLDFFLGHLQQLVNWLRGQGASVIVVHELPNLTGDVTISRTGMSYITDSIVLLRGFESGGALRRAIGVLKKRLTSHEKQFHEYQLTAQGLCIGEPLTQFRGILQGEAETDVATSGRDGHTPEGR
jgi:circadian clock protein KaiC